MKILICEDETIIAEYLALICKDRGYHVAGMAHNTQEAIEKMIYHQPDLVLLDIQMDKPDSGLELAGYINQTMHVPFIFITAFRDAHTIASAARLSPHAYLVKPVDPDTLHANIQLASYRFRNPQRPADLIRVETESGQVEVDAAGLLFIQSDGNYCEFRLEGGRNQLMRTTLMTIEKTLPPYFIRVHKSFIVNTRFITHAWSNGVQMGEHSISVGRVYKQNLIQYLENLNRS